jgi:hypothetical protein
VRCQHYFGPADADHNRHPTDANDYADALEDADSFEYGSSYEYDSSYEYGSCYENTDPGSSDGDQNPETHEHPGGSYCHPYPAVPNETML